MRRRERTKQLVRRWLASKLDPATYETADQMHQCLSHLTDELYEVRYGGKGTPHWCCYQAVIDYGDLVDRAFMAGAKRATTDAVRSACQRSTRAAAITRAIRESTRSSERSR